MGFFSRLFKRKSKAVEQPKYEQYVAPPALPRPPKGNGGGSVTRQTRRRAHSASKNIHDDNLTMGLAAWALTQDTTDYSSHDSGSSSSFDSGYDSGSSDTSSHDSGSYDSGDSGGGSW